jgi:hypothetical protein
MGRLISDGAADQWRRVELNCIYARGREEISESIFRKESTQWDPWAKLSVSADLSWS